MESKKPTFDENFSKVLSMVEEGINIYEALKVIKLDRTIFYKGLSAQQRVELQMAKTMHTKCGVGYYGRNSAK